MSSCSVLDLWGKDSCCRSRMDASAWMILPSLEVGTGQSLYMEVDFGPPGGAKLLAGVAAASARPPGVALKSLPAFKGWPRERVNSSGSVSGNALLRLMARS